MTVQGVLIKGDVLISGIGVPLWHVGLAPFTVHVLAASASLMTMHVYPLYPIHNLRKLDKLTTMLLA